MENSIVPNRGKKMLMTVLTLGVLISAGYFGSSFVNAQDTTPHDVLVSKIAEKFNLDTSDVQAVFDAVMDEKRSEMGKNRENRLNQAVSDGVITEDQKNTLLSKMEERRTERMQNREEMQKWLISHRRKQKMTCRFSLLPAGAATSMSTSQP